MLGGEDEALRCRCVNTKSAARLIIVFVVLLLVAPATAQAPINAAMIVGDWVGQWKSTGGSSGNVYLRIDALDGDQVRGTLFMAVAVPDRGYYNREVPFSGAFDGKDLHIAVPPALRLSLKVVGSRMHGSVQGQQTFGMVELEKR